MSTERNKQIIGQLIQAHVRADRARAAEILSPKLRWHMAGQAGVMGRDEYLAGLEMGARAFSDVANTLDHIIAEGDKVVALSAWRMRHTGPFMDRPATNREVEFTSLWMYSVVDDRVVEIWGFDEDFTGKLR
jgi:predicted ester cyclase